MACGSFQRSCEEYGGEVSVCEVFRLQDSSVEGLSQSLVRQSIWPVAQLIYQLFTYRHEHLYKELAKNLIRSDDFPSDRVAVQRCLKGSRVILCTLSMLSNKKLAHFARQVPLQTVIFDEASQIEIGAYFPMLVQFRPTLRKLVFIGDDKQCTSTSHAMDLISNTSFRSGTIWYKRYP